MIRDTARHVADKWRDALRDVGVAGSLARDYEVAFVNDQNLIAKNL
jgi:serine/threonine-protein kinase HipA